VAIVHGLDPESVDLSEEVGGMPIADLSKTRLEMCAASDLPCVQAARRRRTRWLTLPGLTLAIAVIVMATRARADEPPQSVTSTPPRDYDAPDPDRNLITYSWAAANVSAFTWMTWQYKFILDTEPIFRVTGRDIVNNHIGGVPFDRDTINANFFGHPYARLRTDEI